jgi:hypothetical protein
LQYLRVYCGQLKRQQQPPMFIASDVRRAAAQYGLDIPFEAHEWGPVLQKAAKLGLVVDDGWTTDPTRKYGRTTRWLVS